MDDLRKRFGRLVMTHRKRAGFTQEELAERAGISVDTVAKIEVGATGARFPMIEKIAGALQVDPAELFSAEVPSGTLQRGTLRELTIRLASLPDEQLRWIGGVIDAALKGKSKSG